ncbi:MAG: lycopene cyclase [Myxococcales bacterium]|nr:lycopene cyclase [Myxococcales bacterium]MCB9704867.1 lycopene cyclase [Myxococcales bacterium]
MEVDLAIIGGGCAGLSLAVELAAAEWPPGQRPRVALIEPRTDFVRDRTWCFWPVIPHAFDAAIRARWPRWEVRAPGRQVIRGSSRLPYVQIPADAFYEVALGRLRAAPNVELLLGGAVHEIVDAGDHVALETSAGHLRAALAFDSRPPPIAPGPAPDHDPDATEVTLLQHFVGWEIACDRPCFDPTMATLMDFAVPQGDGLHFFYVLPQAADRALVEATYFTPTTLPTATYEARIRDYLGRRFGVRDFAIELRERGVIPMSSAPARPRASPRVYNIGLRGGLAKASTGYAFLAIQAHARALAGRLARAPRGAPIAPPPARSELAVAMDRVFLSHVARHPERAPGLFADLFERLPPELLIRFLSDRATPLECLRVMSTTPLAAMTREVIRSRGRWLRPATLPLADA